MLMNCVKLLAQMIPLAVQSLAVSQAELCVVLTGQEEACAVLLNKVVAVSVMSSTSTKHILSNSV